jgi:hypothetical protein
MGQLPGIRRTARTLLMSRHDRFESRLARRVNIPRWAVPVHAPKSGQDGLVASHASAS